MHRTERNVTTGETTIIQFTLEEEANAVERARTMEQPLLSAPANQIATPAAQYTDIPECTVAELAELAVNHAMVSDARGPNDDAGKGTGMYCVRIGGVWKTSAGTPVST